MTDDAVCRHHVAEVSRPDCGFRAPARCIAVGDSGIPKRHGMNVQVLTDPLGRLLRASPALPGSAHDLTAARTHTIIDALAAEGLKCWADSDDGRWCRRQV